MVNLGGLEYPIYRLFIIGMSLVVLVLMILLLYKTRLGKIVRAAVSDRDMVNALGINIPVVFMLVFGVGCWLAGIAGVAIAPILTVFPGLAHLWPAELLWCSILIPVGADSDGYFHGRRPGD
jgi:branched-chain amino acid transport system permease protein